LLRQHVTFSLNSNINGFAPDAAEIDGNGFAAVE
jgi:hypothetical protein